MPFPEAPWEAPCASFSFLLAKRNMIQLKINGRLYQKMLFCFIYPHRKVSAWNHKYLLKTIQMGPRAVKNFEILKMYYLIFNFCVTLLQKRTPKGKWQYISSPHLLYQFYSSAVKSDHFCVALWWDRIKRQLFCHSFFAYKSSNAQTSNILKPHWPQCSLINQRLKRGSFFMGYFYGWSVEGMEK